MSDLVLDSCVVAKCLLMEADSPQAQQVLLTAATEGRTVCALDLALPEVANAIWKRVHRGLLTPAEGTALVASLSTLPVLLEPAARLIEPAFAIARDYGRSVYDALFVALCRDRGAEGVTTDEPRYNAVRSSYPEIRLLRDWPPPPAPSVLAPPPPPTP